MKKALICGVSGQDGAYLSKFLLDKGYKVYGGSRDAQIRSFHNLEQLGIKKNIHLLSVNIQDFRSVIQTITDVHPDEIYNLSGQSSPRLSFQQPIETLESISIGTLNILEAIRFLKLSIKFYNAGTGECFGDTGQDGADELTPFRPKSPYAVAKAAAYWEVANYREAYNLFVCTGILFNHESPLRPERFVTKKIIATTCRIANGSSEKLVLGNMNIERDWGWAPEYIEAMWLILQQNKPEDFVIGTGKSYKLEEFVETTFKYVGLDWRDKIVIDKNLYRLSDHTTGRANPQKAMEKLKWQAKYIMPDVVRMMVDAEMATMNKL